MLQDPFKKLKHIAIIPDGNRRWAKQNALKIFKGHKQGAENLFDIVDEAQKIGVETLTFFIFSTENWRRSKGEIRYLLHLLHLYLESKVEKMVNQGIKFSTIGDLSRFSLKIQQALEITKQKTSHCNKTNLVLALNYGGRDEILRAFKALHKDLLERKLNPDALCEQMISSYLDTSAWPDPDLVIRTSGELRLSNFLLWQLSYTEIYTTATLWPDFKKEDLLEAVDNYQKREQRNGGN
jgi:undecaprenyl diphosphate synthase